jgi:hypothetical protein
MQDANDEHLLALNRVDSMIVWTPSSSFALPCNGISLSRDRTLDACRDIVSA